MKKKIASHNDSIELSQHFNIDTVTVFSKKNVFYIPSAQLWLRRSQI